MKLNIGNMKIRDYRGSPYLLQRWAYTTVLEGERALRDAIRFSARYRRHEKHHLFRDKVESGIGKGKTVYVVGSRGTGR